ncbi:MAG: bifunctional diaminohydroxyphosphoribosylaminopyrimidine deaminase/5-amino-6-(5-phosphoribosylamino)uracil reductase RibD [Cyanobacteriota bacterium]|nr:bifunctional diaminohydroxyphosphoribosylaminopyrimidine deaminase/5-amino-6-(5-phosphoribosylamino)uracil reductase RibD [Cyanobacteriota bacterium]
MDAGGLDRYWMQHCLFLAQQVERPPSPNPRVGSVVVAGSRRVGVGFHPGAGQPHAEVFALRQAGGLALGATLYVNLEPCDHYGRTPPCTDAILRAGVGRVVVGMGDPNPRVAGRGIAHLRQAGVEVTVGVEEAACRQLNEAFGFAILQQRSFGILKYAMTLDGKIATATGDSRWVSDPLSRQWVHRLRSQVDAVVVGSGTVWRDDPQLTARWAGIPEDAYQPLRVVVSRRLHLPRQAQIWDPQVAPTLVFTEAPADGEMQGFLQDRGIEVVELPQLTPEQVPQWLYRQKGCLALLWECGGTLAAAALQAGAIQKVAAFIAPKLVGGSTAATPLAGEGIPVMANALGLQGVTVQAIGSDWLMEGYLPEFLSAKESGGGDSTP